MRAGATAAAVLMMSPLYLKSAWRNDERTWFQEQIEDGAAEEGQGRQRLARFSARCAANSMT